MRYVFASKYVRNKIVLDVACGAGYGSHFLATSGAKRVFGVDIDKRAVSFAKEYYTHPRVTYIQGDITNLPFPDEFFDVIISFETIEHLPQPEACVREIRRVLKDNGIFICSTPNIKYTKHPPYHLHEFYPNEFFDLLESNFREVKRYGQYISYFQRLDDLFMPKARLLKVASSILSILPKGRIIGKIIKSKVTKPTYTNPSMICPLKIDQIDISVFDKNKVVSLRGRGILRIMIGVCKK